MKNNQKIIARIPYTCEHRYCNLQRHSAEVGKTNKDESDKPDQKPTA